MRRFIVTYRWELWLFFGIPAITGAIYYGTWFYLCLIFDCRDWLSFIPSVVGLALLAGSYPFVRRQGRELLKILWALELVLEGVANAEHVVFLIRGVELFQFTLPLLGVHLDYYTSDMVGLAALVWFGWRASRISVAHAFLLVGLSLANNQFAATSLLLPHLMEWRYVLGASRLMGQVAMNLVAFWALVQFDRSRVKLRGRIVATLFVVGLLNRLWQSIYLLYVNVPDLGVLWVFRAIDLRWHAVLFTVEIILPLALIYLVRVRDPVPEPEAEPPADLRVQ